MPPEVYYCRKCHEYCYVDNKADWISHVRRYHTLEGYDGREKKDK